MIHREHALQRGVVVFCRRCIAVPHEFAAHDRAASRSAHDYDWQARRGIRAGWPDTELVLPDGKTFRVELKAPKLKFDDESRQADVLHRLNELGHPSAWANSVAMYGQQCERFGVPLHANWRSVAQLIDEHVLAEIRAETVKKTKPQAAPAVVKLRTVRRGQPTLAQIRRGGMTVRYLP